MALLIVTDLIIIGCGPNVILRLLKAVNFVVVVVNVVVVDLLFVTGHITLSSAQ